jgi:hypothetical protein
MHPIYLFIGITLGILLQLLITHLFYRFTHHSLLSMTAALILCDGLVLALLVGLLTTGPLRLALLAATIALTTSLLAALFGYLSTRRERLRT